MGQRRELKFALESFWAGKSSEQQLLHTSRDLRVAHWRLQCAAGIAIPPSNDFSLYDHVLDTAVMLGAIPRRYACPDGPVPLQTYFAMARGSGDAPAMEMTKWFDTNYHYVVPEFESEMHFALRTRKPLEEFLEAKALGISTRPVLLGPVSFLLLGKITEAGRPQAQILEAILPLYAEMLSQLHAAGADWVQIDEPCLVLDLDAQAQAMYRSAYAWLRTQSALPKWMLTTYFGGLNENLNLALELDTTGLHVDLVRAPEQLSAVLAALPKSKVLSLGVVDGRNIWRTDLAAAHEMVAQAVQALGKDRIEVAPSCSLLHSPHDLEQESKLDAELHGWLAFGKQKLEEVALLAGSVEDANSMAAALQANRTRLQARAASTRIHSAAVQQRQRAVDAAMLSRNNPYPVRRKIQAEQLGLPEFPTTTIGSFPQTAEVRAQRAAHKSGKVDTAAYEKFLHEEMERAIRAQEEIGLDVLVHGEFERNDMVEYFGEQLAGFAFTQNGWVQSYGSRCVKPPVIYGDVWRPQPMTVRWSQAAQALTQRPVKGMLTGPVTILQWSFVRNDQPRSATCQQIALAIRDEVRDLETAGICIIQIDEPALREGLPLRKADWQEYLRWSVDAFRLAASGVQDATQIHTHMCYAEFNDIIDAIIRMDADVISMECSRSRMELLHAFERTQYPNAIGPGVYDIHSPRVPSVTEMENLLQKALRVLKPEQIWVNPDCGLKTRGWSEVRLALHNMVAAARQVRCKSLAVGVV
jgi:5-methyltetrahydropteroyltriglutamate--homocysteine methyltransferase